MVLFPLLANVDAITDEQQIDCRSARLLKAVLQLQKSEVEAGREMENMKVGDKEKKRGKGTFKSWLKLEWLG